MFAYALVSRRLSTTIATGPMIFVAAGLVLGQGGLGILESNMDGGAVRILAEATLVLLLFTDAIRIDLMRLRGQAQLPARLLGLGLPLTIAAGTVVALLVLPGIGLWEAALVAAVLTPTDAALGQAVVNSTLVPVRIRQALNVESGLNDGLMLPVITVVLALAATDVDLETPGYWLQFAVAQVGFGVLVGAGIGAAGGKILHAAVVRGWVDGIFRQLGTLAIGVGAFAFAEVASGNGFVAAFVAGMAFAAVAPEECGDAYDFAEDEGNLLALLTFLYFGAALAGPALGEFTWRIGLYAVASLTVIRMIPVGLALLGSRLQMQTVAFLGWFGPRGLASILFGLIVIEESDLPGVEEMLNVVVLTVLLSVMLHGATAHLLSERYGAWFRAEGRAEMAEAQDVEMMRTR